MTCDLFGVSGLFVGEYESVGTTMVNWCVCFTAIIEGLDTVTEMKTHWRENMNNYRLVKLNYFHFCLLTLCICDVIQDAKCVRMYLKCIFFSFLHPKNHCKLMKTPGCWKIDNKINTLSIIINFLRGSWQ